MTDDLRIETLIPQNTESGSVLRDALSAESR